jgi:hypothetical protein
VSCTLHCVQRTLVTYLAHCYLQLPSVYGVIVAEFAQRYSSHYFMRKFQCSCVWYSFKTWTISLLALLVMSLHVIWCGFTSGMCETIPGIPWSNSMDQWSRNVDCCLPHQLFQVCEPNLYGYTSQLFLSSNNNNNNTRHKGSSTIWDLLRGRVHHWFKRKSTRKKKPVIWQQQNDDDYDICC